MAELPEAASPSEPLGPPAAPDAAAKALKKKAKARREWYNFIGRVVAQIIGAAASVGLGLFLIERSQRSERVAAPAPEPLAAAARSTDEPAIAVLPLSNFSEDPRQEYFADGMTEALTAELARIGGLHVISRTSVMRYKTERKPIAVVASELGVDYVVEGSVVRADQRVRVTAQLIEVKSDRHVWARSYDATLENVLDLQARVASAIAAEVKGVVTPVARAPRGPVDPAAYDLYLRGRHAWNLRTPAGFDEAIKFFTAATERDPQFALGYAGLADAFSLYPTNSLVNRSMDNFSRARTAAEKALALDPNLAEAHTSLAAVYFFGERNFGAAAKSFERALELNGHYPTAHQWYAIALSENARHDEARRHADEAVREDPLNGVMHQALGLVNYYARDYPAAIAAERAALELNPQLPLARVVLAKALLMRSAPDEALAVLRQSPQGDSADIRMMTAVALTRSGKRAAAEAMVRPLETQTPPPTEVLTQWHAASGNFDQAFALLQDPAANGGVSAVLRIDPLFEGFRADPRFAAFTPAVR
jgi:TolB-like protein/Flp pilus assembly protein TadD